MTTGGYPFARNQPQPGRGRSSRGQNRGGYGAAAVNQQLHQSFKDFKTATDMLKTSSADLTKTADEMTKATKDNRGAINDLVNSIGQLVNPTQYGGMMGGTMMPGTHMQGVFGPAAGRTGANWGAHGYPGGAGYGMGSAGHGGISARGGGLAGLRNMAAQAIHQQYGTAGYEYREAGTGSNGEQLYQAFSGGASVSPIGTREEVNNHIQRSGRGIVSSATGMPHGMGGALRGARSALGGMAARGGTIGAIGEAGMMAARVATPVAIGAEAVYEGANFIADQRSQNANYQSIYGGTNIAGMRQRFDQTGYRLGQLFSGGMSGAMSDQAFKAVSGMGYGGQARQQRLDFIQSNYKSLGMSPDESMKVIAAASQTLTTSLGDLHTELVNVSKAAVVTGQNAQVMRQAFMTNFAATSGQGLGTAAGPMAQVMSGMVGPSLGRAFAGTSMTGMTSSLTQQAITGSFVGQNNPGQFAANQQNTPMLGAVATDKRMNWMVTGLVPSDTRAYVEKQITEAGGPQVLEGSNGDNIALNIANDPMVTKINPFTVDQVLKFNGIGHNPNDTRQMYGLLVHFIGQQMKVKGGNPTSAAGKMAAAQASNKGMTGKDAIKAYNKASPSTDNAQLTHDMRTGEISTPPKSSKNVAGFSIVHTAHGNVAHYDPVIAKLAKVIGHDGQVMVRTKDGPQVVSLNEAKTKFRDQLIDGTATIVTGHGGKAGSTVADAIGVEDPYSIAHAGQSEQTSDKAHYALGGKYGKKIMALGLTNPDLEKVAKRFKEQGDKGLDVYAKKLKADEDKKADKAMGGKGSIKLYMTPELSKWIGVDTSGDITKSNDTANQGSPAAQTSTGASTPIGTPGFASPFN